MDLLPGWPVPSEVSAALAEVVLEQRCGCWGRFRRGGPDVAPRNPHRGLDFPVRFQHTNAAVPGVAE
eukprot:2788399-Lingulodinium_polyedra.AAC.1